MGPPWRLFGGVLGFFVWASWGSLGGLGVFLGIFQGRLGTLLDAPGPLLGRSWGLFGCYGAPPEAVLEAVDQRRLPSRAIKIISWGTREAILGALGPSWGPVEPLLDHLKASEAHRKRKNTKENILIVFSMSKKEVPKSTWNRLVVLLGLLRRMWLAILSHVWLYSTIVECYLGSLKRSWSLCALAEPPVQVQGRGRVRETPPRRERRAFGRGKKDIYCLRPQGWRNFRYAAVQFRF